MKNFVKILTVILSGMLVFSLFGCKPESEDTPDPDRYQIDLIRPSCPNTIRADCMTALRLVRNSIIKKKT